MMKIMKKKNLSLLMNNWYNYSVAQYCDDCKRLKDIACTCGMSFKDKVKTVNNQWATWSETRKS